MTTAHRPTYNPARGSNYQGGNKLYMPSLQYSSKDLPGNLKLKQRRPGQGTRRDVHGIDFKQELLAREQKSKIKNSSSFGLVSSIYGDGDDFLEANSSFLGQNQDITSDLLGLEEPQKKQKLDEEHSQISVIKKQDTSSGNVFVQDIDDEFDEQSDENPDKDDDDDINDDDEDDEDDEAELMKEYEKIKKMREEEKRQKEREQAEKIKQQSQEEILTGNPLLNANYSLKKKWFEDTVFKNQAKNEPKVKKRFVNDTVRSDFHRKFIARSVQ